MALVAIVLISVLAVFAFPSDSFAWGPATHLDIGLRAIETARDMGLPLSELITRFPHDFLYGNISADIVVAKNMMEERKHCHNWRVGFRVLEAARSDSQAAFASGYLCHLAADTVAHNDFIPEMVIRSFSTRIHRHIYWEMRFDAHAGRRVWHLPDEIALKGHPDNDALLNAVIKGALLSFVTNKRIFSNMVNLQRIGHWHTMLNLLSKRSRWDFDNDAREEWMSKCMEAVFGFLRDGEKAACVERDPTGKKRLVEADRARKKLREARRKGRDWDAELSEALSELSLQPIARQKIL
jgi:hypothetical protein